MSVKTINGKWGLSCVFESETLLIRDNRKNKTSVHTLIGLHIDEEHPDLTTSLEVNEGDEIFVVWVDWNESDSDSSHAGHSVEALAAFKSRDCATKFALFLEQDFKDKENGVIRKKPVSFETKDGQKFEFSASLPWTGYGSRLRDIHVQKFGVTVNLRNSRIKFS